MIYSTQYSLDWNFLRPMPNPPNVACPNPPHFHFSHKTPILFSNRKTMKFFYGAFLLVIASMAPSSIRAECDDKEGNPLCIVQNGSCLDKMDDCCEGLACFGYNFFKKCQPPPSCLPEWYDCSQGMECCKGFVCAATATGNAECQVETVDTRLFDPGHSISEPTSPPTESENMITLGKSNLNFAGSWGDP